MSDVKHKDAKKKKNQTILLAILIIFGGLFVGINEYNKRPGQTSFSSSSTPSVKATPSSPKSNTNKGPVKVVTAPEPVRVVPAKRLADIRNDYINASPSEALAARKLDADYLYPVVVKEEAMKKLQTSIAKLEFERAEYAAKTAALNEKGLSALEDTVDTGAEIDTGVNSGVQRRKIDTQSEEEAEKAIRVGDFILRGITGGPSDNVLVHLEANGRRFNVKNGGKINNLFDVRYSSGTVDVCLEQECSTLN